MEKPTTIRHKNWELAKFANGIIVLSKHWFNRKANTWESDRIKASKDELKELRKFLDRLK